MNILLEEAQKFVSLRKQCGLNVLREHLEELFGAALVVKVLGEDPLLFFMQNTDLQVDLEKATLQVVKGGVPTLREILERVFAFFSQNSATELGLSEIEKDLNNEFGLAWEPLITKEYGSLKEFLSGRFPFIVEKPDSYLDTSVILNLRCESRIEGMDVPKGILSFDLEEVNKNSRKMVLETNTKRLDRLYKDIREGVLRKLRYLETKETEGAVELVSKSMVTLSSLEKKWGEILPCEELSDMELIIDVKANIVDGLLKMKQELEDFVQETP